MPFSEAKNTRKTLENTINLQEFKIKDNYIDNKADQVRPQSWSK